MAKVYYGKDSIQPDFLRSQDDPETEVFRSSQLAKSSLRNSESASQENFSATNSPLTSVQELEERPFYTGTSSENHTKKFNLFRSKNKSKTKKYAPLLITFGAFFAIIIFIFLSVSNLGNQIEMLITRATDTMFGSYSENSIRITEELLAKKHGAFPKIF